MKRTLGSSTVIIDVVELLIEQLTKHIQVLVDAAVALIESSPTLLRRYELLDSIPGVGELSAFHLLAELQCLPEGLGVRQLVAHAGLDPRPWESGSSVRGKRRISKRGNAHLRHALYMPALSAARTNDTIRAYAAEVEARVTCRQQAICAVMRKMLHSIVGMFRTDTAFDATRFRAVQG
jgi:transposase